MSDSVLEPHNAPTCLATIDVEERKCHIFVACTRRRGHPTTGHEFVGVIGGRHLHVVWGEPEGMEIIP